MSNIKSNKGRMVKIINEEDASLLNNVNDYCKKIKAKCDKLLVDTKIECANLKTEVQKKARDELQQLSQKLYMDNYGQIQNILNSLEQDIYRIIYKILVDKLHIEKISHTEVSSLIKSELSDLIYDSKVTLSCNSDNLEYLKKDLADIDKYDITYKTNDKLKSGQCLLESSISIIHVDLEDCRDKILKFLH